MTSALLLILALLLQAPATVPDNIFIQTELKKEITARRSRPGQAVVLQVSDDVKSNTGAVLIPAGAKLTGKIVAARKRNKGEPSAVSFIVEKAEWKNGSMPLKAIIERLQALGSTTQSGDCGPNLNRAGMSACGGAVGVLQPLPADCSVTEIEQGKAVVCSKRDLELGPGSVFVLRNTSLSGSHSGKRFDALGVLPVQ